MLVLGNLVYIGYQAAVAVPARKSGEKEWGNENTNTFKFTLKITLTPSFELDTEALMAEDRQLVPIMLRALV